MRTVPPTVPRVPIARRLGRAGADHLLDHRLSRRTFVRGAGLAEGAAAGSQLLGPLAWAGTTAKPIPIPGGTEVGGELFHFYPPVPGSDQSAITHFAGYFGTAVIRGKWHVTDGDPADGVTDGAFEVDNRFMKGLYKGKDGGFHQGAFGFV